MSLIIGGIATIPEANAFIMNTTMYPIQSAFDARSLLLPRDTISQLVSMYPNAIEQGMLDRAYCIYVDQEARGFIALMRILYLLSLGKNVYIVCDNELDADIVSDYIKHIYGYNSFRVTEVNDFIALNNSDPHLSTFSVHGLERFDYLKDRFFTLDFEWLEQVVGQYDL